MDDSHYMVLDATYVCSRGNDALVCNNFGSPGRCVVNNNNLLTNIRMFHASIHDGNEVIFLKFDAG